MKTKTLMALFFLVWIVLLVRIYYLSIKSNTYYEEIAKRNAIKVENIVPLRGSIKDVNGTALSVNKLGFSIGIKPHLSYKSKREFLDEQIDFIVSFFKDQDREKLKKRYLKKDSPYGHDYVQVVDFISYKDIIPKYSMISLNQNIKIIPSSKRFYPYGSLASHVLGYVAKANLKEVREDDIVKLSGFIGRSGIEKFYNKELEGEMGYRKSKVTAHNEELEEIGKKLSSSKDITLSLDLRLQKEISSLFDKKSGAVIVMNAKNGEIIAASSFPEYDLNKFVNGISVKEWGELSNDFNHPFTNKLINGLYPPGSIIKMGVALAFLKSKKMNENTSFFCEGEMKLGGRKFRCWKEKGHRKTSMNKAIRESCDDYFYKGGFRVGIDNIAPVLRRLGFSKKTGIDLPGEFIGTVPGRIWKMQKYNKPWYQGETLITSIGQGYFLSTPLQVARYTAMLATGFGVTPHLVKNIGEEELKFPIQKDILSDFEKKQLPKIQKAMYEVCNHPAGTATHYLSSIVDVAGKTGTAQVVGIPQSEKKRMKESELEYYKRSHAWLSTYGPYKDPQVVVTVLVEHGGHGGHAAGPIVSKIYNKLLELGYIKD